MRPRALLGLALVVLVACGRTGPGIPPNEPDVATGAGESAAVLLISDDDCALAPAAHVAPGPIVIEIINQTRYSTEIGLRMLDAPDRYADFATHVDTQRERIARGEPIAGPPIYSSPAATVPLGPGQDWSFTAAVTEGRYTLVCRFFQGTTIRGIRLAQPLDVTR